MRVHFVFLIIAFVPLIRGRGYPYRDYNYDYVDEYDYGPNYGPVYGPVHGPGYYSGGSSGVNQRGLADIATNAVGFLSKKAKQVIKLIRCVLQCFIKYFVSNYCKRMFPCLYDCAIGQTYIAPEVEKQLKSAKSIYPKGFDLADIYKSFKCLYTCAMERPIKNWETLATAMYCVADTCVCYNIFGAAMN